MMLAIARNGRIYLNRQIGKGTMTAAALSLLRLNNVAQHRLLRTEESYPASGSMLTEPVCPLRAITAALVLKHTI